MRFKWHAVLACAWALGFASIAEARVELVEWQQPAPGEVSGFKLHLGSSSGSYETVLDVGLPSQVDGRFSEPVAVGDADMVYVAVSAYNAAGSSPLSNEGMLAPPLPPPNDPPVAHAGADQTRVDTDGSGAEAVSLDGSGSSDADGTVASWAWRKGGTPLASGVTPTVSLAVGVHTIDLVVTDDDGASASDRVVVTVELAPPPPGGGGTPQVDDTETFSSFEKEWRVAGAMDVWGNGKADLLWRQGSSAAHELWLMDGGSVMAEVPFETPGKKWQLVGSGDVDGEGTDDLVWWDKKQKRISIWVNWASPEGAIELTQGAAEAKWQPVGVGDVDGDGHADLVWYAKKERAYYAWRLDENGLASVLQFDPPGRKWKLAGLGDFDGNGTADLLWLDKKAGYRVWLQNGAETRVEGDLGLPEKGWKLTGIGDLDGDGRDDLLWDHKKQGCHVWVLDGDRVREEAFLMEAEKHWSVAGVGDFDADGIDDVLLQHKKDLEARIAFIGVAP